MKKVGTIIFLLVVFFCLMFGLASCGNNDKIPSSNYEKVQFAFNGVEKSFSSSNSLKSYDSNSDENVKLNSYNNVSNYLEVNDSSSALSTIESVYTSGDSQGNVIDDLEYTQPPMIQFQCLKAVLDKVGSGYQFGTKYYDDITGEVYIDVTSGKKVDSDSTDANNFKYNYTFKLSIDISIDDNDLITADVLFNIKIKNNAEEYNSKWYVNLKLDYDMKNITPNYTLLMLTANDQHELQYSDGYTYEYDYVDVKENKINEWRKFCLETNQELVKDNNHNSIDSYTNDSSFEYEIGAQKWYKNKDLRKITKMTEDKKHTLGNAYYSLLGLNSTDIDSSDFVNKNGVQNKTITDVYAEFSRIFRMDIIYDLLVEEDHEEQNGGDNQSSIIGIIVRNGNGKDAQRFEQVTLNGDPTLFEILDEASSPTYWSGGACPVFYLQYNDNGREEKLSFEGVTNLNYSILIDKSTPIALDQKISDVLLTFGDSVKNENSFNLIITYPNTNITAKINCGIGEDLKTILQSSGAKQEILNLGFPAVKSENAEYNKSNDLYLIENIEYYDAWNYIDSLKAAGFVEVNSGNVYAKITKDNKLLRAQVIQEKEFKIQLQVKTDLSTIWNQQLVNSTINNELINVTGPTGKQILFEYITTGDYKRVIVYGLTDEEKETYIESLNKDIQFITNGIYSYNRVLRVIDDKNNKFYELPIIDNYNNLEISLSTTEILLLTFKYQINDGEIKTFTATYSKDEQNISYNSEVIYLNGEDTITFYGTDDMPIVMVEANAGQSDEFEQRDNTTLMLAPKRSGYYIINYYHTNYVENHLWVQFLSAPNPNDPKK